MCDFEKTRNPAPVAQDVLEGVKGLKNQTIKIRECGETQAIPLSQTPALEDFVWQLEVDHIPVSLPKTEMQLYEARKGGTVEVFVGLRQAEGLGRKYRFILVFQPGASGFLGVSRIKKHLLCFVG